MSLARASGLTTLIIAILVTAVLMTFAGMRAAFDVGDVVERVLLFFPVALVGVAPITLVAFPLLHVLLRRRIAITGRLFAGAGAVLGAIITGYVMIRFKGALFPTFSIAFIAVPLLSLVGAGAGFVAGFLFRWLTRNREDAFPDH